MAFSVRERQIDALKRMLQLNLSPDSEEYWQNLWKVLIYDDWGQHILAPLFSGEELRRQGITLHLSLHKPRQPLIDVPAVYFVSPTKENIARICEDCAKNLYATYHLNFTSSVPSSLLEELAYSTLSTHSHKNIVRVYDQYMNFISLEDHLFFTRHSDSYFNFHNPVVSDDEAIRNIEETVDSLFSVVAALGKVPVIQCPRKGDAAELIAKKLDEKIREHLSNVANLFSESGPTASPSTLMRTNTGPGGGATSSFQRPVLIILDRNVDLTVMMSHAWSYQALVHDLLDLKNNSIALNTKKDGKEVVQKYYLDPNDPFWKQNAAVPIYQVAVSVQQQVDDLKAKTKKSPEAAEEEEQEEDHLAVTKDLSRKLDMIPEIKKQQENMGMHAKIALALLDIINNRGLDVFFRIEEGVMARSALQKKKDILSALDGKGTAKDKLRLFLIYYIMHQNITKAELSEFEEKLASLECDLTPLKYLKAFKAFDDNWSTTTNSNSNNNNNNNNNAAPFGDWVGAFKTMFSAGVQLFVPTTKDYYVTRIVDAIMEIRQDKIIQDFLYFDPTQKLPSGVLSSAGGGGAQRRSTPFREAIVFMVGGGNYLEFLNLKEYAANSIPKDGIPHIGKTIIYGSTEMLTGEQFLEQLQKLGGVSTN